ncbi:MAG: hypothetical protein WCS99_13190 [Limisphaerales bacterium]
MRVTANSFPSALINQLGSLAQRQGRLQEQASTGQRVSTPSDDPTAMRRVLDLQSDAAANTQYKRNAQVHQEMATVTGTTLKSLNKLSSRAGEIATLADGLKSPQELKIYGREVTQMIQQAVQLMNTKQRGKYLFGGTSTDQPPFVMATGPGGEISSVTYQGNASVAESEIGNGELFNTVPPGVNTSGSGPTGMIADSRNGADLFAHLISLQNNLLAGNTSAVSAVDRPQLASDEDNLIQHMGINGALQARLETAVSQRDDSALALEKQVSSEADADLSQTIVRLNATMTAYQAALQGGGRAMNLSLLDYIR